MVKEFHEGLWTIHYYQLHNYWDNLENTALHVAFIGFCQEKKGTVCYRWFYSCFYIYLKKQTNKPACMFILSWYYWQLYVKADKLQTTSVSTLVSLQMESLEGDELCFPHLLNTSCRRTATYRPTIILTKSLMIFMSLLTAALNLLVIISISHFRQRSSPCIHFIRRNSFAHFVILCKSILILKIMFCK